MDRTRNPKPEKPTNSVYSGSGSVRFRLTGLKCPALASCALSTQFRNLRPNLAPLVKGVVQLCVEHGSQVDHVAQPGTALTN
jgi:hypothetical protein